MSAPRPWAAAHADVAGGHGPLEELLRTALNHLTDAAWPLSDAARCLSALGLAAERRRAAWMVDRVIVLRLTLANLLVPPVDVNERERGVSRHGRTGATWPSPAPKPSSPGGGSNRVPLEQMPDGGCA